MKPETKFMPPGMSLFFAAGVLLLSNLFVWSFFMTCYRLNGLYADICGVASSFDGFFSVGVNALSFRDSRTDRYVSLVDARVPVVMIWDATFKSSFESALISVDYSSRDVIAISAWSECSLSLFLKELSLILFTSTLTFLTDDFCLLGSVIIFWRWERSLFCSGLFVSWLLICYGI